MRLALPVDVRALVLEACHLESLYYLVSCVARVARHAGVVEADVYTLTLFHFHLVVVLHVFIVAKHSDLLLVDFV